MRPPPIQLTIGQQILAMRRRFPQFTFQRIRGRPTWTGELQPNPESQPYRVSITLCLPNPPRVRVVTPAFQRRPPHIYPDGSLCLYYPPDGSWRRSKFLADTIVPWAACWLACYELWLVTGEWYGPEAPHDRRKRQE